MPIDSKLNHQYLLWLSYRLNLMIESWNDITSPFHLDIAYMQGHAFKFQFNARAKQESKFLSMYYWLIGNYMETLFLKNNFSTSHCGVWKTLTRISVEINIWYFYSQIYMTLTYIIINCIVLFLFGFKYFLIGTTALHHLIRSFLKH